jgi:hypothetical protein
MAYMLFCGLPCLRREGAQGEGKASILLLRGKREECKSKQQGVKLKCPKKLQLKFEHF